MAASAVQWYCLGSGSPDYTAVCKSWPHLCDKITSPESDGASEIKTVVSDPLTQWRAGSGYKTVCYNQQHVVVNGEHQRVILLQ